MFPQKRDQSFISTPVSRVGSSVRLNQFTGPNGSRPASRPATPGTYVTSSLNPARNIPVTSNNARSKLKTPEEVAGFEELPVVESLRKFEATFTELSQSITSFKEVGLLNEVENLIQIQDQILSEISNLETHQRLGIEIQTLAKMNESLDSHAKTTLKELISCRSKLRNLPKLPASRENAQKMNEVDVKAVLDYAMKLAKFSKMPATVSSQLVHPNNYVWPAEDALRRGVLATASIKPEELIRAEIGEAQLELGPSSLPSSTAKDVEMEDADSLDVRDLSHNEALPSKDRDATIVSNEPTSKTDTGTLDLDLFDPDDDDDDSD